MRAIIIGVVAVLLTACTTGQDVRSKHSPGGTVVEQMRNDIEKLNQRDDKDVDTIEVQHLLVAHKDAGVPGVTRSLEEAEQLAAELYAKVGEGADFDALVKEHTDDAHPGIYGMTMSGPGDRDANIYPRGGMVAAFGDVGWKLDVGEVGVAPFDRDTSPYGWHIIKRTK